MLGISIEDMQNFLRINNEEDAELLYDLIESATDDVTKYVNRIYKVGEFPYKMKVTAMKIVAIEYEHRYEDNKQLIDNELRKLHSIRGLPGL